MHRKKYYAIAITGGPCGGKSSGISGIADYLESLGFRVIIVSEAATRAMEGRIDVERFGLPSFQRHLIRAALNDEMLARQIAEETGTLDRPVVILFDRTWHDSRAYMPMEMWLECGRESGALERAPLSGYDGVIHLASTAVGRPDLFALHRANNPKRIEKTAEEATQRDEGVRQAYTGSEQWRFIDNSGTFAQKMEAAVNAACAFIGIPEPRWFQRKFVVESVDRDALERAHPVAIDIFEYWLDGYRWRRRKILEDGSESYARVHKINDPDPGRQIKVVTAVDSDTFYSGWDRARAMNAPHLDRTRFSLESGGTRVVLDEYRTPRGRTLFEAHVGQRMGHFVKPPWITLGREVTGEERHTSEAYAYPAPP